ncbi:hypothetical protein PHMEG_00026699 [Phytophthora megakarya]|uniref:Uncharacterized protein n=1 Tax=Phytophthora megakarya TaxID=4795 RepID=A0A225V9T1_9STRA|nr:hypothetical protein PHMEG_00026699 [Phytophthora megakarya]
MTPLSPHVLSNIDRINAALEVAVTQPPPVTGMLRVCQATEDEWNAVLTATDTRFDPNALNEIRIIEFADTPQEDCICAFNQGTSFTEKHIGQWLKGHMAAKNSRGR